MKKFSDSNASWKYRPHLCKVFHRRLGLRKVQEMGGPRCQNPEERLERRRRAQKKYRERQVVTAWSLPIKLLRDWYPEYPEKSGKLLLIQPLLLRFFWIAQRQRAAKNIAMTSRKQEAQANTLTTANRRRLA
jgi:hypothetical protein